MRKELILTMLAGLFVVPAFSQCPPQDKNWEVIFQDDFSIFNTSLWNKAHNHVHGGYDYSNPDARGEEAQVYIQDNVYIENGKLVLKTKQQTYLCPKGQGYLNCQYGGTHNYTSGQIGSNVPYKYGYFEIYAKLPTSSGYWSAFWLWNNTPSTQTSNCWYNEIDIFEAYGHKPNAVESNSHCFTTCPIDFEHLNSLGAMTHACNFATGYHWYGVEWDKNNRTWYVDRKAVRQIANNKCGIGIQNPMYIILNVALYPWDNVVNSNTVFPNYMYIDQANAYRLRCDGEPVVEIPNYNAFNYGVKKSITLSGVSSLKAGEDIYLRATDFIELKEGFEVPIGAELYLDITPCEIESKTKIVPNCPNPFYDFTTIECYVSEKVLNAELQVYDVHGTLVKTVIVSERGKIYIRINAIDLHFAGTYTYCLVADNDKSEIMQMVFSKEDEKVTVYQNYPNPFNEITTVECYIPQNILNA